MLEYALLHLGKSVVIFIKHLLDLLQIEVVFCKFAPGQIEQRFEVVQSDGVLGYLRIHAAEFVNLAGESVRHVFGPLFLHGPGNQRIYFLFLRVLAQLLLNGLQLLVKEVVALLLLYIGSDFILNLVLQFQQLQLGVHVLKYLAGLFLEVAQLQNFLFLIELDAKIGRDKIQQKVIVVDVLEHHNRFRGNLWRQFYNVTGGIAYAADHRPKFQFVLDGIVLQCDNTTQHVGLLGLNLLQHETLAALKYGCGGAIGHFQQFQYTRNSAHLVQVSGGGRFNFDIFLG